MKRYVWAAKVMLLMASVLVLLAVAPPVSAATKIDLDPATSFTRVNRMTIQAGNSTNPVFFYATNTTADSLTGVNFNAVNTSCPAKITYIQAVKNSPGPSGTVLSYQLKLSNGSCGTTTTKQISVSGWSDTQNTVFALWHDNVVSVKADNTVPFKQVGSGPIGGGTGGVVYIQGTDPFACPAIIVNHNNGDWRFIPLVRTNTPDLEIRQLFSNVFGSRNDDSGPQCAYPPDPGQSLASYGLNESWYRGKDGESIGFGYGHNMIRSIKIDTPTVAAVGLAGAGPYASIAADAQTTGGNGDVTADRETCNVSGIGWIVCPLSIFMAKLTDSIYNFVEQLLFFQPNTNMLDTSNPVYKVWDNIRNLANIVFVVALFIVIFSQATSIGISNYGIKKMLPRIFAAAVLVNLSYYVCLFGLDVSNIIGAGIDGIIKSVPLSNGAGTSSDTTGASGAVATLGIAALTTTLLASSIAASGGLFAALAGLMVFLPVILMSVLTALVVLVGRQALIILLIIVSPLAFAAMILPNTDKLFASWRKAFTTMLVFYPLVAVLFSGTQVAASVLRLSANGGGVGDQLIKVMSLGVQTFPLFALPFLLKFSGGVLGKVAGVVNNPNKGPFDKMQKGLDARAERTRDNAQSRNLGNFQGKSKRNPGRAAWWQRGSGASASRRAETEWLNQQSKSSAQSRRQSHIGQNLSNLSSGLAQQGAGGRRATEEDIAKAVAAGMEAVNELEAKNLKAGRVVISELGLNEDQKAELANTGRTTGRNGQEIRGELYRAAQISSYAEEGQISRLDTALQNLGSASSSTKKYTVDALGRSYATLKQKGHYLNDEQLKETIRGGGTVSRELLIDAAGRASPELSPQLLSTQDQQAMERTVEAYHTSMSLEGKVKIRAAAKEVKGNRNLQANLVQGDGKSRDIIENYLV